MREVPDGWESLTPAGMPGIVGRLLAQRGVLDGEVERFLQPKLAQLSDPFEMSEMERTVKRVFQAIDEDEKVCIYGDYDVDGISSITLLTLILQAYGLESRSFIPHRTNEGYGLSEAGLARCQAENGKPDLLVAVDCGTVSHDAIAGLKADGIDVVVLDHHEMGEAGRPDCVALVNPKACGDRLPYLCAAGVVFKLGHALLKRRPLADFDLKDVLDLVAVATISDIVPLVEENRLLVRHGLRVLSRSRRPGLHALQNVSGTKGALTSQDVGFRIGPRINAAGRMDCPEEALATLMAGSDKEARFLAENLDDYNRRRQKLEKTMHAEALAQMEADPDSETRPVIVVASRDWHAGVVGIVASRLMRRFHKPTFAIAIDAEGVGKASGRSIEGVSLVEAINSCREFLLAGGGHHMAAGLSIAEENLAVFRERFADFVRENCRAEDLRPRIRLDGEVRLGELSLEFLDRYDLLQPFGNSNPQPVFMSRGVWLTEAPRHLKNNHLRLFLRQEGHERDAIFFGGGMHDLPDPPWDVAFTIDRNVFRGQAQLQISIQRVRASGE